MAHNISGSCLCGEVTFTLEDNFSQFYFCYCEQCRKMTGSGHASNLFTAPNNICWTKGKELVTRFDLPNRQFTKAFCKCCGSALPYVSQSKKFLIVPAGSLDQEPQKILDSHIFCAEKTDWYKSSADSTQCNGFPE